MIRPRDGCPDPRYVALVPDTEIRPTLEQLHEFFSLLSMFPILTEIVGEGWCHLGPEVEILFVWSSQPELTRFHELALCPNLRTIIIGGDTPKLTSFCFGHLDVLQSIRIYSRIEKVTDSGLKMCSSLIEISLPPSVTRIGIKAFSLCTSLQFLSVPIHLNGCSKSMCYGASSLESVES
jgi:hypothetical protein